MFGVHEDFEKEKTRLHKEARLLREEMEVLKGHYFLRRLKTGELLIT